METKGDMKYYSHYRIHDLFELQESLSGLSKSNRWVKLADRLPWAKIEKEYNKRLRNSHCGAGNKPARMVVGALIVKHVENLSNDRHAEEKRRAICERNEIEATFGTSKRVYRANDIWAKLDNTADTWIGACFFAKNVMKFLRGLLCLIFAKLGLKAFKRRFSYSIDYLMGVLDPTRGCLVKII